MRSPGGRSWACWRGYRRMEAGIEGVGGVGWGAIEGNSAWGGRLGARRGQRLALIWFRGTARRSGAEQVEPLVGAGEVLGPAPMLGETEDDLAQNPLPGGPLRGYRHPQRLTPRERSGLIGRLVTELLAAFHLGDQCPARSRRQLRYYRSSEVPELAIKRCPWKLVACAGLAGVWCARER